MISSDSYFEHWKTGILIALLLHLSVLLMAMFGPDLLKLHQKKEEIYTVKLFAPVEQAVKSKDSPAPNSASTPVSPAPSKVQPPKPAKKLVRPPVVKKTAPHPPKPVQKKSLPAKRPEPQVKKVEKERQIQKKAVSLKPEKEKKKVEKPVKPKAVKKKPAKKSEKKAAKPKTAKAKKEPSQEEILARRLAAIKEQIREKEEAKRLEERLKALREQVKKGKKTSTRATGASVSGSGRAKSINEVIAEYGNRVSSEIWRRWNLPTSLIDQKGLEAVIEIKIADDGTILERRFEKASGDLIFDRSAMRAVKEASHVPPLPPQLRPGPLVMGIRFRPEGM